MIEDPQGFADVGARTRQLFGDDSVWEGPLYTRVARSVYTEHRCAAMSIPGPHRDAISPAGPEAMCLLLRLPDGPRVCTAPVGFVVPPEVIRARAAQRMAARIRLLPCCHTVPTSLKPAACNAATCVDSKPDTAASGWPEARWMWMDDSTGSAAAASHH